MFKSVKDIFKTIYIHVETCQNLALNLFKRKISLYLDKTIPVLWHHKKGKYEIKEKKNQEMFVDNKIKLLFFFGFFLPEKKRTTWDPQSDKIFFFCFDSFFK